MCSNESMAAFKLDSCSRSSPMQDVSAAYAFVSDKLKTTEEKLLEIGVGAVTSKKKGVKDEKL